MSEHKDEFGWFIEKVFFFVDIYLELGAVTFFDIRQFSVQKKMERRNFSHKGQFICSQRHIFVSLHSFFLCDLQ